MVILAQPEEDTTENVILSRLVLMQPVFQLCRCFANLDEVQSSISGWREMAEHSPYNIHCRFMIIY